MPRITMVSYLLNIFFLLLWLCFILNSILTFRIYLSYHHIFVCLSKLSKNKYNLGKTSLMFAADKRYGDVIFTILVKGADINAKDNNG